MVDDVKDITETAESKASQEILDRGRVARERREAEQRKRLDELRAHAAAAQAQREKRDEDRRRRQAEQRTRDDDRRVQVEERKRAIWEASVSRREALLQRERDRTERLERQRAARSAPRPAFAFGSSTPRLLEPLDSGGFFWAARRAASTTNVMFASAPLTRRASALHLDSSDTDNKDEPDRQQLPAMWSSVARRRTDLVPTLPAPRAPGRAYSMTRLDRLPHSPATHHSRTQTRSGETTPSRPGSALSSATAGVVRRPATTPRKPRPASIAGTGVNTPRGGVGEMLAQSAATTPTVSRDSTMVGTNSVPRRPASTPRRPRPASMHTTTKPATPVAPGEGKPPLHRKPKPSKEHDRTPRGKSASASPGRGLSPSPPRHRDSSRDKELHKVAVSGEKRQVSAQEVTHKLEALQIQNGEHTVDKPTIETQDTVADTKTNETKPEPPKATQHIEQNQEAPKPIEKVEEVRPIVMNIEDKPIENQQIEKPIQNKEAPKPVEKKDEKVEKKEERREEKKEPSMEKTDDYDMTASMTARRITTEEEAKAALAERRRRAREELEKQAELERQRLQREAEEEVERQRLEREREMREEQEARELAQLQRRMDEEKLRKAIEAQQQLERDEAERKTREEGERQAKLKEEEEKRKAAEEAEKQRKEEAEREEKERLARKQRVEAIMARTRLRKAEEDKKQQESKQSLPNQTQPSSPAAESNVQTVDNSTVGNGATVVSADLSIPDNGNVATDDLLGFSSQSEAPAPAAPAPAPARVEDGSGDAPQNNGNLTADLLGLSQQTISEDKTVELPPTKTPTIDNTTTLPAETNNGNLHADNSAQLSASQVSANQLSANFIQNEIATNESQTKMADNLLLDDDFTTHNGHGTLNHPLTLQNAI